MAAGLGTRLRPLTYEIPKPLVPVANRPIMEHILARLAARRRSSEVIANLHWFPETIRDHFGDGSALGVELTYSTRSELLGTAGGVRNVREFFGAEPFLVHGRRRAHRHRPGGAGRAPTRQHDGVATLAVKRVAEHAASTGSSSPAPTAASRASRRSRTRPRRSPTSPTA